MAARSDIEWTDASWNWLRGCSRESPGCEHCYAEAIAARFSDPGMAYHGFAKRTPAGPRWTRRVSLIPERLEDPLRWREPRRIFVNSTSDTFHPEVNDETIAAGFGVMAACPAHTFQVLTKRADRLLDWHRWLERHVAYYRTTPVGGLVHYAQRRSEHRALRGEIDFWRWPLPNVWVGVSVEDQRRADQRIPLLQKTPAALRFLSVEPLLEPVDLRNMLDGIGWVIVGGESGPGARPMHLDWAARVVDACAAAAVPVFLKQLGARPLASHPDHPVALRLASRKGADPDEWPPGLRRREFPSEAAITASARAEGLASAQRIDRMPRCPIPRVIGAAN